MFNELVQLTPQQALRKLAIVRVTKQRMDRLYKVAEPTTPTTEPNLKALALLSLLAATPYAYGAITAPKGRRMHGAGSTAAQTVGTLGGALYGAGLGSIGGIGLAGGYSRGNKAPSSMVLPAAIGGAALGSLGGGYVGNYIFRNLHPGPRQLGLGNVEDDKDMPKAADVMDTLKDYGQKALTGVKDFGKPPEYRGLPVRGLPSVAPPGTGLPVKGVPVKGVPAVAPPGTGLPVRGLPVRGLPIRGLPSVAPSGTGLPKAAGIMTRKMQTPRTLRFLSDAHKGALPEPLMLQTREPTALGRFFGYKDPDDILAKVISKHYEMPGSSHNLNADAALETMMGRYPYFELTAPRAIVIDDPNNLSQTSKEYERQSKRTVDAKEDAFIRRLDHMTAELYPEKYGKTADVMDTLKDYGQKALTGVQDFGNQVLEGTKAGNPLYTGGIGAAALGGLSALREMGKEKERQNWANPLLAGAAGAGLGAAVPLGLNAVRELSDNSKFKDPGTDITKNLDSVLVAPREPVSNAITGLGKQVGPSLGPVGPGLEYAGGVVKPILGTAIGGAVTGNIRNTNHRLNLLLDGFENVNDAKFNPEVKQHLLEQLGEAGNFQSRTPVKNPTAAAKAVLGQKMMDEVNRARMARGGFDLNLKQMARHKAYGPLMAHGKVRPGSWLSMIPLGLGLGADAYNAMRGGSNP